MDPRILALIAQAAGETVAGVSRGVPKINLLSPEQRNRVKELERQQALGLLGIDEATQQRMLNQQLQPVQALGRQAIQQAQQSQLIGDVGQGAAFRQQAAQQGALQQATIDATQRAQQQIEQMDELARARQLSEMRALQKQRQTTKEGVTDIIGSLAGGAAMGAQVKAAKKELDTYESSLLTQAQQKQLDAMKKASDGEASPDFMEAYLKAIKSLNKPASLPTPPSAPSEPSVAPAVISPAVQDVLPMLMSGLGLPATVPAVPTSVVEPTTPMLPNPYIIGEQINTGDTYGYKVLEVGPDGNPTQIQWFDSTYPAGKPGLIFNKNNPDHSIHFIDLFEGSRGRP
tara:strand:- start:5589 stop:6620 length:1032 start_codon:yes stop_codon:yes gene_type:complete